VDSEAPLANSIIELPVTWGGGHGCFPIREGALLFHSASGPVAEASS
jgi:hypothetical protein